jgi:hypothetical protein
MRKIVYLATATMLSYAALDVQRAEAAVLDHAALGAAIAGLDADTVERVHCRPGREHHRWRFGQPTWDGCVGPVVVVPGFGGRHHRWHDGGRRDGDRRDGDRRGGGGGRR